jgi:hypothetical protein
VVKVLYPRYGLELAGDSQLRTWLYDTDDYQEIMGYQIASAGLHHTAKYEFGECDAYP